MDLILHATEVFIETWIVLGYFFLPFSADIYIYFAILTLPIFCYGDFIDLNSPNLKRHFYRYVSYDPWYL